MFEHQNAKLFPFVLSSRSLYFFLAPLLSSSFFSFASSFSSYFAMSGVLLTVNTYVCVCVSFTVCYRSMFGLQKSLRAVLSGTWKGKTVNPSVTCYCFEGGNPGRWKNSHNCPYNTATAVKDLVLNKIWTCSCHMQLIGIHKNIQVSNVFKQIYKIMQSLTHMTCRQTLIL